MYENSGEASCAFRIPEESECRLEYPEALPSGSEDLNTRTIQDEATYTNPGGQLLIHASPSEMLLGECTRWGALSHSPYGWPAVRFLEGEDPFSGTLPLSPGWQERVIRESRTLMQNYSASAEILEIVSSDTTSKLSPDEENAICAVVPKLVRVSMSGPVRGVYLDRGRALWRANWREGGRVRTKGFRIAKWGTYEARRKAIEVRKLMETRACFLRLKAVAYGFARGMKRSQLAESKAWQEQGYSEESWVVSVKEQATRAKRVRRLG